jgi:hypothetical protein
MNSKQLTLALSEAYGNPVVSAGTPNSFFVGPSTDNHKCTLRINVSGYPKPVIRGYRDLQVPVTYYWQGTIKSENTAHLYPDFSLLRQGDDHWALDTPSIMVSHIQTLRSIGLTVMEREPGYRWSDLLELQKSPQESKDEYYSLYLEWMTDSRMNPNYHIPCTLELMRRMVAYCKSL